MAIVNGWVTWAIRHDGPAVKSGYPAFGKTSPKRGIVPHSVVGPLAAALAVLANLELVGGRFKHGSWQFTNAKDGRLFQHYPVLTNCWHGGDVDGDQGVRANIDLIGIEHEGGPPSNVSEPLTNAQIDTDVRLYREFEDSLGFKPYQRAVTVFEHNEVSDSPTACPSNRIPHAEIRRRLDEEDDLSQKQYDELKREIKDLRSLLYNVKPGTEPGSIIKLTDVDKAHNRGIEDLAKRLKVLEDAD